jgi:hypothetical protein
VALWALDLGVRTVSIEPSGIPHGLPEPALARENAPRHDRGARRALVEQDVLYLHAGDVAVRLFRPSADVAQSSVDHESAHRRMDDVEPSGTVQITWCDHVWQRASQLLCAADRWPLVTGLARQLLALRTLREDEVSRYLRLASARLKRESPMPSAIPADEVIHVCSPWHRRWLEQSLAATPRAMSSELPASLADLFAHADLRPVESVLRLSMRAGRLLQRAGVQTVVDLEDWNEWSLAALHGGGKKTVAEILAAAASAGVRTGPPTRQFPWELNPGRWRSDPRRRASCAPDRTM